MEVLPEALDPVVIRRVGRQEVQPDAGESHERASSLVAGVDAVIVEHDVDELRGSVVLMQTVEHRDEEGAVLLLGADPEHGAVTRIERAGKIRLLVLARRDDQLLLSATPRAIQSSPIFGFRCTSASSSQTATSFAGNFAMSCSIALSRRR
jgi:hypothetical protein